jgi:DMSO/TMAO reductase YedYZ heme-binding membrane subunit
MLALTFMAGDQFKTLPAGLRNFVFQFAAELALMATFAFGFWQISSTNSQQLGISAETKFLFRLGISAAIMVVGCIGLVLNINIEGLRVLHMERARAARRAIGFLEEFINVSKRTGKPTRPL